MGDKCRGAEGGTDLQPLVTPFGGSIFGIGISQRHTTPACRILMARRGAQEQGHTHTVLHFHLQLLHPEWALEPLVPSSSSLGTLELLSDRSSFMSRQKTSPWLLATQAMSPAVLIVMLRTLVDGVPMVQR